MAYQPYNYNPMYSNGYNTQNYGQPQYAQAQPTFQPQPSSLLFNEVKFANENEVNSFCPNPNQRVLLFDTDNNVFRIKYADTFGKTTTETYKFEKVDNLSRPNTSLEFDPKEFVKTSDLDGFIKEETLNAKFNEFSKAFTKQIDELSKKIKLKDMFNEEKKNG